MIDLTFLTPKDVTTLHEKADFTEDQLAILKHLRKGDLSDEGIMLELQLSRNKYYKIKADLLCKIIRAAVQS